MSTQKSAPPTRPMAGPMRGPMGGMFGGPPAKSKDFKTSFKRLLVEIGEERKTLFLVLSLITMSVTIGAFGPKILGRATNEIFYGFLGRKIPANVSKAEAISGLRTSGQDRLADMLEKSSVVPGHGIDFTAVGKILTLAIVLYLISAFFLWLQAYLMTGVTQRTVYRLRRLTEEKIGRLPLGYFDTQSRGDLLSRVTNDIDNISNSMQQGLSQILNSFLTIISILIMMLWISPELALISLIAVLSQCLHPSRLQKHHKNNSLHNGAGLENSTAMSRKCIQDMLL